MAVLIMKEEVLILSGGSIKLKDLLGKVPEGYSFKGLLEVSRRGQNLNSFGDLNTAKLKKVANLAAVIHESGEALISLLFEKSSQLNIVSDDGREMITMFFLEENIIIVTCEKA